MPESWVTKQQDRSDAERPSFKKIKRAVRSENFPHSHVDWHGCRDDSSVTGAEDLLIAAHMLVRTYPDPESRRITSAAQCALTGALFVKFTGKPYEFCRDDDVAGHAQYDKAWQMVQRFDRAIERAVSRLLPQPPTAQQTP